MKKLNGFKKLSNEHLEFLRTIKPEYFLGKKISVPDGRPKYYRKAADGRTDQVVDGEMAENMVRVLRNIATFLQDELANAARKH